MYMIGHGHCGPPNAYPAQPAARRRLTPVVLVDVRGMSCVRSHHAHVPGVAIDPLEALFAGLEATAVREVKLVDSQS